MMVRRGSRAATAMLARLLSMGLAAVSAPARAATGDIGYVGLSTTGDGSAATGEKPESKLWRNDGLWRAALLDTGSQTHRRYWHADIALGAS